MLIHTCVRLRERADRQDEFDHSAALCAANSGRAAVARVGCQALLFKALDVTPNRGLGLRSAKPSSQLSLSGRGADAKKQFRLCSNAIDVLSSALFVAAVGQSKKEAKVLEQLFSWCNIAVAV